MERHQGLILRTYFPKKHKISLFDKHLGRIEARGSYSYSIESLLPGAIINYYSLDRPENIFELADISIQEMPLALARHDIYFFHHILELCYYFLPLNMAAQTIYDSLIFLIKSYDKLHSAEHKNLFLLRFFLNLGIYPEEDLCLDYLLYEPIDVMLEKTVIVSENKLKQWLMTCIEEHPQKAKFRTLISGCSNAL